MGANPPKIRMCAYEHSQDIKRPKNHAHVHFLASLVCTILN